MPDRRHRDETWGQQPILLAPEDSSRDNNQVAVTEQIKSQLSQLFWNQSWQGVKNESRADNKDNRSSQLPTLKSTMIWHRDYYPSFLEDAWSDETPKDKI